MRILARSFAFLDILSLVFLSMQLWVIVTNINELGQETLENKINAALMFPMFWLILIGAYGFFFLKKFGYILYYIQFPIRLYLWIFTVGFITLLPEAFSLYEDAWFDVLLKICFAFEFMRVYFVIRMHMNKGIL